MVDGKFQISVGREGSLVPFMFHAWSCWKSIEYIAFASWYGYDQKYPGSWIFKDKRIETPASYEYKYYLIKSDSRSRFRSRPRNRGRNSSA